MYTIKPKGAAAVPKKSKEKWAEEDMIFLQKKYKMYTNEVLSQKLNRSERAIIAKYRKCFLGTEKHEIKDIKPKAFVPYRDVSRDLVMYFLTKGMGIKECVEEILKFKNNEKTN